MQEEASVSSCYPSYRLSRSLEYKLADTCGLACFRVIVQRWTGYGFSGLYKPKLLKSLLEIVNPLLVKSDDHSIIIVL